ncbi:CPBP family intramembrane glutamic endopeptidase [Lacrimispora sp.]|uniref:CPBP family intramembrane glutamic endopeptidase n=1 Tax=Lacrimispora sp. TaxID=2719234 RepID=UPI00285ECB10|nr:CPBP family intramembrane glutamic endopeptidase [Lacrimispora sp.]MDR7814505.1 CPBP family intramembrane glutamic endopeptidase [Lacrimispora sp.]
MLDYKRKPIPIIFMLYAICFAFRTIEYFIFRTDQSMIGEAFIHKLAGILLLVFSIPFFRYSWTEVGFSPEKAFRTMLLGALLGAVVFTAGYGIEILIQLSTGNFSGLKFYVTSYSDLGNRWMQSGILFIMICIAGNMINVIMEEGVFRGLFVRLAEEKYSFPAACILSSVLFGVWHIMQPLRNVIDGNQSMAGAFMAGLILVVTSTLLGIQYCMLYKLTGSLWAGMAAHFVNNTTANLLHVVTVSGVDELLTVRITIAQTLSFLIVLFFYISRNRKK